MATPYSQDLRDRVLAADDRGMKTKPIATLFCVSPAWVRRVKQRRRETGETTPRKMGSPGVRKIDRDRLTELVRSDPDATLAELRDRLGIECSCWGIGKVLKQLGYTFKKRRSMPRSRIAPTLLNAAPNGERGQRMLMLDA
jgi:transposase